MGELAASYYEAQFRVKFLAAKGNAFQDLFAAIMSKAHPGDFIPCRPWGHLGDRKNDGYLRSGRTLFQVYAPNEMKIANAVRKIEQDFRGALPFWQLHFDTWVFVHNAPDGLPPDVIEKLLTLEHEHGEISLRAWGYDELLLCIRKLNPEALASLFGPLPKDEKKQEVSEARRKVKLAEELVRDGKHAESAKEMTEALSLAQASGDEEEEAEILIALAITSSDRRGRGDRQQYIRLAEAKVDKLKSAVGKALYHRARAQALLDDGDNRGAEKSFREALRCCASDADDKKGNLAAQGCVVRASFVHFLCSQGRREEATQLLKEAETYARANPEDREGELLQAALEAGIHYSLDAGDEDGAIFRIAELEASATTGRLSARIAGDLNNVANQASHRERYRAALAAAQSSIRLGLKSRERASTFLSGAYYTEAMVILKAGNPELALEKAEALLDFCQGPDDSPIMQATQQLIAEIRRTSGDSQAAVELARQALASARGDPENVAIAKRALAGALNDNGQTEEALNEIKEAWALLEHSDIPPEGRVDFLSLITSYASQLGKRATLLSALDELKRVPGKSAKVREEKELALARVKAFTRLRKRLTAAGTVGREGRRTAELPDSQSLAEANAAVVRPLLDLWDGFGLSASDALAGMYDFWGRGNFERLLHNAKRFPHSFNITLEVRSLEDVKRAVRLWGLYADFLLLLWKGPTDNGLAIVPVPQGYEGPGGWGYMVCYGDVLDVDDSTGTWHPALAHSSMFPADVAAFLATEARPFLEAGRLIVVPAVGAGCINPGHGPFEQLLAEAANAIPSVRWKGVAGTPIGLVPHSPDAPFALLAELAATEAARLRKLRLLLLRRSQQLRPDGGIELEAKVLSLEIDDALRDFEDRSATLARKGYVRAKEPVEAAFARFKEDGRRLSDPDNASPFAPLLVLQSLGYGWRVDNPHVPHLPPRFEPDRGDVVGTWLAPPTAGWTIPVGRRLAPYEQGDQPRKGKRRQGHSNERQNARR